MDAKPITLTRADVDAIIERRRVASPEDLQYIIDNAKSLHLAEGARNQIGCDLSILMAQRARNMNGRRDNPSAEFIAKVLGYSSTPHGLVERDWVNRLLRAGAEAIARCRNHRPPNCQCWSASRVALWQAQANGEKTPEAWCATSIYAFLEDLELSSRPERQE